MHLTGLAVTCLVLMPFTAAAQNAPTSQTAGAPTPGGPVQAGPEQKPGPGTAVIRGRVVRADTGEPLRRVEVAAAANEAHRVLTDAEGRYEITRLTPGSYQLRASKGGYTDMNYGQRRPFGSGRPLTITDGQTLDAINFALSPGGVITGRILDEAGEPAVSATVSAWRPVRGKAQRQNSIGGSASTDDRGEFRIFGLPPGRYVIRASPSMRSDLSGGGTGHVTTYYPGTPLPADAQTVTLKAGDPGGPHVLGGADPHRQRLRRRRNRDGTPALRAMVILRDVSKDASVDDMFRASLALEDGAFVVGNVPPGTYRVEARSMMNSSVEVRVIPESLDEHALSAGSMPGPPHDDWTFELTGLSGRRLLRAFALRGEWTTKSVRVQGLDVTDTPIEFTGGDVDGIEIVLTNRATELSEIVTDDKGAPVEGGTVVAFADDPEKWGPRTRFIQSSPLDQHGRFRVRGLPPEDYVVVALDELEPGEETDVDLLERLRTKGTRVRLREAETRSLDLKLTAY